MREREAEIDSLNAKAWALRHAEPEHSRILAQEAYEKSGAGDLAANPYLPGRLAGLTTLGFLDNQLGRLDRALTLLFEAVPIAEALPPGRVTIDMWRIIGWVFFFLGDLSAALGFGATALRLADELGLLAEKASVLDGLAMTYAASGDRTQALERHQQALEIAASIGDRTLESSVLNNLANNLLSMGDSAGALANAQKSLEIARGLGHPDLQTSTLDTIASVLQQMGETDRAQAAAEEGLRLSRELGQEMGQMYCLLNLGRIHKARHQLDTAAERIEGALQIAERIGARPVEADCCLLVSEVAEMRGDLARALAFSRRHVALREQILAETNAKRLAGLKVAHEVETARRDAEIFRLRNVELQKEIQERSRVEVELQRLATTDALTGICNRRHFFELAARELARTARYKTPLCALMIDFDKFKAINDTHGHAVGDQVLQLASGVLQRQVRSTDVLGRYGGEEFCVALPQTDIAGAMLTAERIRRAVSTQPFTTSAGPVPLTISIGVAELRSQDSAAANALDSLLDRADQALRAAKRVRNRVVSAGDA